MRQEKITSNQKKGEQYMELKKSNRRHNDPVSHKNIDH